MRECFDVLRNVEDEAAVELSDREFSWTPLCPPSNAVNTVVWRL